MLPSNKLESWQGIGAQQSSINSHNSVRSALLNSSRLRGIKYKIFLQGSYKNHTNIRADSDVDIVIMLNDVFFCNISDDQRRSLGYQDAKYGYSDFKNDIFWILSEHYGPENVKKGNKSIKLSFNSIGYVPADIIICNHSCPK